MARSLGVSNASGDTPSGRFDPRNIQVIPQPEGVEVSFPDGTKRIYHGGNRVY